MKELKLTFSKETIERFDSYLKSELYLKEQNLTEHWGNFENLKIKAFKVKGNNIFVRLNHDYGLFDQIDISQNFATPKNKYKLVKTTCDSSEPVLSLVKSKLRSFRKILLRRLGCYNGIAYSPLYHFERLWRGREGEITVEDIIAEYGAKIDSSTIVKGSHIYNEINEINQSSRINFSKIIEIGPGVGSCIRMFKNYKADIKVLLIDIPTSIPFSFLSLMNRFPEAKYLLPNEVDESLKFDNKDFIFLSNEQIKLISNNEFDLAINSMSFAEMKMSDIEEYFQLLRRVLKKQNLFYCLNRVEKLMLHDGDKYPIRFFEYPWLPEDLDYKYEISPVEMPRNFNPFYVRATRMAVNH